VPHVFACLLSYVFFAKAAFFAFKQLFSKTPENEERACGLVKMGFAFLTAGIALGSIWAASAWGDWWGWDRKRLFHLLSGLYLRRFCISGIFTNKGFYG